jgi:hypothetical protein
MAEAQIARCAGVVPAILARGPLRAPVASPTPWRSVGIEPRNASETFAVSSRQEEGLSAPLPGPTTASVRRWTARGAYAALDPHHALAHGDDHMAFEPSGHLTNLSQVGCAYAKDRQRGSLSTAGFCQRVGPPHARAGGAARGSGPALRAPWTSAAPVDVLEVSAPGNVAESPSLRRVFQEMH